MTAMDVQCERCRTEYEFDDALVSGRGTTVRCTSCGHQFKVRRLEAGAPVADRWTVRTADGHELTFFSLRDLQQAITSRRVQRDDILVQSGGKTRTLAAISELGPFFQGLTSLAPPQPVPADTATDGVAIKKASRPWDSAHDLPFVPSSSTPAVAQEPTADKKIETLRPPAHAAAAPPPATLIYPRPVRAMPPPTAPMRVAPVDSEEMGEPRAPMPSTTEESYAPAPSRGVGGSIVAAALLVAVIVVGWAVAKPYLAVRNSDSTSKADTRIDSFLAEGEKALAEGNLDVAQADFDKASVLSEKDARVLVDQARLATVKADVPWLEQRLLPADAAQQLATGKARLGELVGRARHAADEALAAAPDDVGAQRVAIDSLRLAGDSATARTRVPKLLARASQPETAYVLAALDLAEPEPVWATVIERLRVAEGAEGSNARARAALVYALVKSGQIPAARSELETLEAVSRSFPLIPALHSLIDRTGPDARPAASVSAAVPPKEVPGPPPAAPRGAAPAAPPEGAGAYLDPHAAMQAAAAALHKGDLARARQLYSSVVDRNPSDSEALSGLGDVSRRQGNLSAAVAEYRRAIQVNPSYLPALVGLADSEWARGDHAKASAAYTDIVDRFPEGTYPAYVGKRAQGAATQPEPNVSAGSE